MVGNVGFVSLGCPKNLVDSQNILTLLQQEGYHITATYEDSELVIINTCAFIESAIAESLEVIEEALNHCGQVVITGCLGPRRDFILEHFPQVKAITGPHSPQEVLEIIKELLPLPATTRRVHLPQGGTILTPKPYAYLKISEGCSHRCSFCIIPKIRGDLESFDPEVILKQAQAYVERGFKELLVVAQDTTAYGMDKQYPSFRGYERGDLYALTREIAKLGVWQRVHYSYPYPHIIKLVEQMAEGLVLPYLDVPLQHVNARILKAMKRPGAHDKNLENIKLWRSICPEIAIRSTFIVGFPGETEEEFSELLSFIAEARLDRVGCFTYSPVHNADANLLPNQIPEEVKQERLDRFMTLQQQISLEKQQAKIGTTLDVIIDEIADDCLIGRTKADAPEIDGEFILSLPTKKLVHVGDIVKATVTATSEYDLEGTIVE